MVWKRWAMVVGLCLAAGCVGWLSAGGASAEPTDNQKDRGRYEKLISGQDIRAGFLLVDEGWILYQSDKGHLLAYRQGQRYGVAKAGSYDASKVYCEPHRIILQGRDRSIWAWYPPGR